MEELFRLRVAYDASHLPHLDSDAPLADGIPFTADLQASDQCCSDLKQKVERGEVRDVASVDQVFGPVIYAALRHLPAEVLSDLRFWQWLTLCRLRSFAELRLERKLPGIVEPSLIVRILGGRSLEGVSRQLLARLFFACRSLANGDDLSAATGVLARQQKMVDIFERRIGVNPHLARVSAAIVSGVNDDQVKKRMVRLQALSQTVLLDLIPEDELIAMF